MAVTKQDRWLLPGRQYELPGRDLLAAAALHARRESMFLVFATLILTATIALPLFSSGTVLDLGGALRLPQTAELTFGVAVFPVAILVSQLVCELYGSRRAYALGFAAVFACAAVAALAFAADALPPTAWPLALVAFGTAAHLSHAWIFSAMRRALHGHHLLGRSLLAMATSQVIGQACFLLAINAAGEDIANVRNAASVGAAWACACAVIAIAPLMLIRRLLSVYLRVGRTDELAVDHTAGPIAARRSNRLPAAVLVDDEPGSSTGPGRRAARSSPHAFSHSEIAFFLEGEELSESV